jgi:hypothetical protein
MTNNYACITDADIAVCRPAVLWAFGRPWAERVGIASGRFAFAGVIVSCRWHMDFTPQRLWQGMKTFHLGPGLCIGNHGS